MDRILASRKKDLVKALRAYDEKEYTSAFFYADCEDDSEPTCSIDHKHRWETRDGDLYACVERTLEAFEGLSIQNEYGKMVITLEHTEEEILEKLNEMEEATYEREDDLNLFITSNKANKGELITFFGELDGVGEIAINAKTEYLPPKEQEVSLGLRFDGEDETLQGALKILRESKRFNVCQL